MIYLATKPFLGAFLGWATTEHRAGDLIGKISVRSYEGLLELPSLPARSTFLTDHERLTPGQRQLAIQLWDALGDHGVRRFNNPRTVLNRPRLLKALQEAGINDFRAFFPDEIPGDVNYPVFIREANEHTGSLTRLLETEAQLGRHLTLLKRFGGFKDRDLLIVEYVDVSDGEGIYRKYAVQRMKEWWQPRYLEFATRWMIKAEARLVREDLLAEEREYYYSNPHLEELKRVFEIAGIEYGRVDYGVKNGRIQVWEINTHPQIGPYPGKESSLSKEDRARRAEITEGFHDVFRSKLRAMIEEDAGNPQPEIPWAVAPGLVKQIRGEAKALHRRRRVQGTLRRARQSPGLRKLAATLSR